MKKLEVKKFGKLKLNKESLSMLKGGDLPVNNPETDEANRSRYRPCIKANPSRHLCC